MVRHSEDWWGVLRQGIELENTGLVRHGAERLGGSRPGEDRLGMEIELEHMARHAGFWWALVLSGSLGSGKVRFGKYRHGAEIELQNIGSVWTATAGYCVLGRCWLRLDRVWKSN